MGLIVPEHLEKFNIMTVDPGLNNIGVAIYSINFMTNSVVGIEAFTFHPERLPYAGPYDDEQHGIRPAKLYNLRKCIAHTLETYKPVAMAYETPFFNRRRPTAFQALVESIGAIRGAIEDFNPFMDIVQLPPLVIKQFIGATSSKDKNFMLEAVQRHPEITEKLLYPLALLDEHAIDAVSIGYAYCRMEGYHV